MGWCHLYLGTVLAIAGEDFSIVASDTRLSEGFSIHTRDSPKCYKLTDKTVIGCSGFHGDCLTLTKIIEARLKMYKHSNNKAMTTGAIAAMLSTILYSRRFFPYYVYNIIGGLDEEGKGAVYSFDPVGSYQRDSFKAGGSASAMLQPLLDNQVSALRQKVNKSKYRKSLKLTRFSRFLPPRLNNTDCGELISDKPRCKGYF
ncbi:proteasome subunit beta type-1-like protein [Cricetulus griseus]|nr:proteasome subunit beta type-1-like protein [Cricetulus griseus]